jgi:hypothetical protein
MSKHELRNFQMSSIIMIIAWLFVYHPVDNVKDIGETTFAGEGFQI